MHVADVSHMWTLLAHLEVKITLFFICLLCLLHKNAIIAAMIRGPDMTPSLKSLGIPTVGKVSFV